MKLTPELLAQAPSALNPVKERQLDLRGKSTKKFVFSLYANCHARIQNPRNRKPWCDQGSVLDLTLPRTLVNPSSVCRTNTMPLTLRITPSSL